ncbi:MAG: hypothetical protein J7M40_04035 [Planctomycetes bacterium]|nr:hypothetical protein [Planctomycetota bacterium]
MEHWRVKGLMCLVVVLIATAGARASSAMLSNDTGLFETGALRTTSSADWQLENIGRQMTDPAQTPSPFQEGHTANTTTLPAVPAAISMTLCGFLCISFVRDRRAWLAMAAGALWLGQTGMHAVPELTHRICSRITTSASSPIGLDRPQVFFSSDSITGNAQSISFIGLLRKLEGIPGHNLGSTLLDLSFPRENVTPVKTGARSGNRRLSSPIANNLKVGGVLVFASKHSTRSPALALRDCRHNALFVCPASVSGHFTVFSPAFIFQNLSRGPPAIKIRVFPTEGPKSGFAKRSLGSTRHGKRGNNFI